MRSLTAAAAAAVAVLGCSERIMAPGECPVLCPTQEVQVVDTTLTGVVVSDTSYRGFWLPRNAPILVAGVHDSTTSVSVIRFAGRPARFPLPNDPDGADVGPTDSIALEVTLTQRDTAARNVRLLVYRLPATVDTATRYADLLPFLMDSALVDSVMLADTLAAGLVRHMLPVSRVTEAADDSGVVALAIFARANTPTAVSLAAADLTGLPARLKHYVRGAAPKDTFRFAFDLPAVFDTFVSDPETAPTGPGALVVGNLPSARAIMRFNVPRAIVDSTTVVRATLRLTLTRPVRGRPGESFDVEVLPVLRDYGDKSITIPDFGAQGRGTVRQGATGVVELEMARVLRFWATTTLDSVPRTVILRAAGESNVLGELSVARGSAATGAPTIRVTFVRPYRFGLP